MLAEECVELIPTVDLLVGWVDDAEYPVPNATRQKIVAPVGEDEKPSRNEDAGYLLQCP